MILAQNVSYNEEFKIDTFPMKSNSNPIACKLDSNRFVLCWRSREIGLQNGFYGQIFNNDFVKIDSVFKINTNYYHGLANLSICKLNDGGFIICWTSYLSMLESGHDIFGQVFNSDGSKRGEEFRVNSTIDKDQDKPIVTSLKNGFFVCWESQHKWFNAKDIIAQRFDNYGTKDGTEYRINTYSNGYQENHDLARLSDGKFVVCWQSYYPSSSEKGAFFQFFDNTGLKLGSEMRANTSEEESPNLTKAYDLKDSTFVICWEDNSGISPKIDAQLFDYNGAKIGTKFNISYSKPNNISIGRLGNGNFVVSWEETNHQSNYPANRIGNAQIINIKGEKVFSPFYIKDKNFINHFVFQLDDDKLFIFWTNLEDIYGKYYLTEPVYHSLKSFSLLKPSYDQTLQSINFYFSWDKASNDHINLPVEIEYTLLLSETPVFPSPLIINHIYETEYYIDSLKQGETYFWKVLAENIAGDSLWSSETNAFFVDWDATTSIEEITDPKPQKLKLHQNYPNPFNPSTTIEFEVAKPSHVLLKIFDLQGREVAILMDKDMQADTHKVTFNADNLASGVYFYHIQIGSYQKTKKMLFLR